MAYVTSSFVQPNCGHKICANLAISGAKFGKGVSTVVHDGSAIILGKVGLGKRFGYLTVCSGNFELGIDRCWLDTAIRELHEEFKIDATVKRFECAALVDSATVFLFNCHGHNLVDLQKRVMTDHQTARRIIGLADDDACRMLVDSDDEPMAVTFAAEHGEMQTLVSMMYSRNIYQDKSVLGYCVSNIHAMMQWKMYGVVTKKTRIVWSA